MIDQKLKTRVLEIKATIQNIVVKEICVSLCDSAVKGRW